MEKCTPGRLVSCSPYGLLLVAAPAHAMDVRSMIGVGIGAAQQLDGMAQRAQAAERRRQIQYQAQMRRYQLSQTKAGRRQLAREDRAARAQEQRNMRVMQGLMGAAIGGMLGGGGEGGSQSRDVWYRYPDSSSSGSGYSSAPSTPPISSWYGCSNGSAQC